MHAPLTAGRTLRSWDGGWFAVVESIHRPHQVVPSHAHANPDITILRRGAYETGSRSKRLTCTPGTALFLPGGYEHDDRFADRETQTLIIELRRPGWEKLGRRTSPPIEGSLLEGTAVEWLSRRIESLLSPGARPSISALEELVVELLGSFIQCDDALAAGARPRWLIEACEEIRWSFRTDVRLSLLAERAGLHAVHFARAFRSHMGCSVGRLVRRLRIEAACEALAATDAPLAAVSASVGFYDQAQFSRIFRRCVGVTPGQFRRAVRSNKS